MSNSIASTYERFGKGLITLFETTGQITLLMTRTLRSMVQSKIEWRLVLHQFQQIGLRSFAIAAATAIFVGIVMALQFAFSLERFGARDSVGRIIGLSEARELAPSLTALVVGARVGAGIAAELGSMAVTEQIDAIRALGADPIRKLVAPRLIAGTIVMPLLTVFALVLGIGSAMLVCYLNFGIPMPFFLSSARDSIDIPSLLSGMAKTPVFGFLITLFGCYYGINTTGGTEGVGQSTTTSVVAVSIGVLVSDAMLTHLLLTLFGT